ncbi:MAG: recombinase family protein, partial [Firmicutes bacterium]|nr:recombinase family protein [Bacillota bacterium]
MYGILASYAQAESLSVSENQKWRIRKSFQNGELMNWRFMFGYTITNGKIEINEAEAVVVREIMQRIIASESLASISRDLNKRGIQPRLGGTWNHARIRLLVSNEKLTGNALLQKKFVNNHLEKKLMHNM